MIKSTRNSNSSILRSVCLLVMTYVSIGNMKCGTKTAAVVDALNLFASYSSSSSSSTSWVTRTQFLSASAATFVGAVAIDPEACDAATTAASSSSITKSKSNNYNTNPRYLESELEMKYGTDSNGNPRTRGILVRRFTGDSTPYSFPVKPIRLVNEWPTDKPPFKEEDFLRSDSLDDSSFYTVPRFVYHIDEPAVASLTQYYRNNIPKGSNILDICSSWVSHYPLEFPKIMNQICATGMNTFELAANDQLTGGYQQADLNNNPSLSFYKDNSFDVVTLVVSVDYLISPIEVLKEVCRVLRPGGKLIISQSNRCFPSKAISMWLKMNDRQHLELINGYIQYAGGFVEPRKAYDITAIVPDNSYHDPMFIVEAIKK